MSRRPVVRFAALTVLAVAATAGAAQATTAPPEADAEVWTYTDGSGKTVTLDELPDRIVMHASSAAALIPLGIEPVAIYADQPVDEDPQLRGIDLDGIEIVGEEWGIINLEAVAALDPDLVVAEWWPVEAGYSGLEPNSGGSYDLMVEIAPVVGVAQGPSVVGMIEDYEVLAGSLGADLESPAVAEQRDRFLAAVERFEEAVASQPGLTVLAVSAGPEALYIAVPEHAAELSDFMSWGLDIVVPDPDPAFPYWQELSWEQADLYQADLVIVDDRVASVLESAEAQPTWQTIAAVEAGAVTSWPAFWLRNYAAYADQLGLLTDAVLAADPMLVE